VAALPAPVSAATEQQQHDNNNQDQFHRDSALINYKTTLRWRLIAERRERFSDKLFVCIGPFCSSE